MMLAEAFHDEGQAITKNFFPSVDVSDKAWSSVSLLAEADDITFWTVIAHHDKLSSVFTNLVTAVDQAHSSASLARRRSIRKEDERSLCLIFIRLATTTSECIKRRASTASLARRLDTILPVPLLFPIAVMLLRQAGSAASVCLTSFFLLNPGYLCRMPLFMLNWYDAINRLATRCKSELQRGRFQRMSGDILPLIEQTFRHVRQIWAAVHCCPFLADYMSISRVLRALRIVVDVVSPLLQHFVMHCKDLNPLRDILSQANSILINSALNASLVLVLFHPFCYVGGRRAWVLPKPVQEAYAALREAIVRYAIGVPAQLVGNPHTFRDLPSLFEALVPATVEDQDLRIGKVVLSVLSEEIQGSKDFVELLSKEGCRHRYGELLLLELIHQGVRFDELLSRNFLSVREAEKLGACEEVIACALSRSPQEFDVSKVGDAGGVNPALSSRLVPSEDKGTCVSADDNPHGGTDPAVGMVQEVFPQYSVAGIRAALDYYGDPEQFILDASMDNIPPHLVDVLNAALPVQGRAVGAARSDDEPAEVGVGEQACVTKDDLDSDLKGVNLHLYLGSDLYELLSGDDEDRGEAGVDADYAKWDAAYTGVTSYRKEESDFSARNLAFNIDEDLKDKIRMLNELLYEDELDDTGLDVVALDNNVEDAVDSESSVTEGTGEPTGDAEEIVNSPTEGHRADPVLAKPMKTPNDDYHRKQLHVKQAKERADFLKKRRADGAAAAGDGANQTPSYANKKKTEKRPLKGRSNQKNDLLKAVRKGRLYADL